MKSLGNIERLELRAHFIQVLKRSECADLYECRATMEQIGKEAKSAIDEYLKVRRYYEKPL